MHPIREGCAGSPPGTDILKQKSNLFFYRLVYMKFGALQRPLRRAWDRYDDSALLMRSRWQTEVYNKTTIILNFQLEILRIPQL